MINIGEIYFLKELGLSLNNADEGALTPDARLAREPAEQEKLDWIDKLTSAAVAVLEDKKGLDIEVLKVSVKTTLADVFILASGTSTVHVRTLAESVEEKLEELFGVEPGHIEGLENRNWVLLDYGDLIVHLLMPEDRAHYKLENLWRVDMDRQPL